MSLKLQQEFNIPIISVIIPCYNDGCYINEAIESVNVQTYKNIEIIVVDDGSNDMQTIEILSKLNQSNLKILFLNKNSGPSFARNEGISIAKGKYILPLDADDKIATTYIEKAKNILESQSNIGIVYCEAEFFGERTGKWDLDTYSFEKILVSNMIFATAMYRKTDWETIGGYSKNMKNGNEDYDLWLSILELDLQVYQIPEVLFSYRVKKVSRTSKLKKDQTIEMESYIQIFNNHKKLYKSNIKIFFDLSKKNQFKILDQENKIIRLHKDLYNLLLRDKDLTYVKSIVELRDKEIEEKNILLNELLNSKSWKLTQPLREFRIGVKKILDFF